jgi:RNA polymerase sigma-70 factor (ECF subfamily)
MTVAGSARPSLEAVVEQYRPRIYRHIRSLVRNRADAEELTQEAFLRAHQRLESLKEPAALGGWLYRIATHVCYDFLRRASRRPDRSRGNDEAGRAEELALAAEGPGLDQLVERAEMNACGGDLLEKLPRSYRTVLLLHDLHGLTSVEIARLLRCTPGTVKIRLHRARRRLRAAVEEGCDLYRDQRGVLVGGRKPRKR